MAKSILILTKRGMNATEIAVNLLDCRKPMAVVSASPTKRVSRIATMIFGERTANHSVTRSPTA
jgi:hypothetical protein